jgi:hypothetical protein
VLFLSISGHVVYKLLRVRPLKVTLCLIPALQVFFELLMKLEHLLALDVGELDVLPGLKDFEQVKPLL